MDQLEAVTVEIGSHFESRQQWIDQLDEILTDAENDRVTKVI